MAEYNIQEGDSLQLLDLEGVIVLTPKLTLVPQLAQEIERLRVEAAVTMEQMLKGLSEERERCYAEDYVQDQ